MSTFAPPQEEGQSLIAVGSLEEKPDLGSADIITGFIIDRHSSLDSEHAGSGYLSLAVMVVCSANHDSFWDGFPVRTLAPHSRARVCNSLTIFY